MDANYSISSPEQMIPSTPASQSCKSYAAKGSPSFAETAYPSWPTPFEYMVNMLWTQSHWGPLEDVPPPWAIGCSLLTFYCATDLADKWGPVVSMLIIVQAPSLGTILGISASSPHSFELCLWASVLYLSVFYASDGKICPKIITSSLYATLAYKKFHRNTLLFDNGGNLYIHIYWTCFILLTHKKWF